MEPVEINAGTWYLRALRADDRIDDRPGLAQIGETEPDYVAQSIARWLHDRSYTWAVCEPTTGELLAEVALEVATGLVSVRSRPGHGEAAEIAGAAVRRFAEAHGIGSG